MTELSIRVVDDKAFSKLEQSALTFRSAVNRAEASMISLSTPLHLRVSLTRAKSCFDGDCSFGLV